jgi:hypothetical protein
MTDREEHVALHALDRADAVRSQEGEHARNAGSQPGPEHDPRARLSCLGLHCLGGTAGHQVGRDVRVGQAAPDRRTQKVRLGLIDTTQHHAHAFEGGLDREGLTDVHPPTPHSVPQFDRELRGLFGATTRHDDTVRVVRREICCNAASHSPVAAGDQYVSALQYALQLLWRAGRQSPGANGAAGSG